MRALLGLIAIVLLLAICGWITFSWNGNRASVNVETERIESDTERIVDEGQEVLDAVKREVSDGDTTTGDSRMSEDDLSEPEVVNPPADSLRDGSTELERRE